MQKQRIHHHSGLIALLLVTSASLLGCGSPEEELVWVARESTAFTFSAPAHWTVYDARVAYHAGWTDVIVGTVPVPAECGRPHVEIHCYLQQRLQPGTVSLILGGQAFMLPEDAHGILQPGERVTVAGRDAVRLEQAFWPQSFYQEDRAVTWYLSQPEAPGNYFTLAARIRGPDVDVLMAQVEQLVATLAIC